MKTNLIILFLALSALLWLGFANEKNDEYLIPIDDLGTAVNVTSKRFPNVQLDVSDDSLLIAVIRESGEVPVYLEASESGNLKVVTRSQSEGGFIQTIDEDGDGLPDKRMVFGKDGSFVRIEKLKVVVE